MFDFDGALGEDMKTRRIDCLTLRVHFPDNFPTAPPFVHMLRPRLRHGTGYVFDGALAAPLAHRRRASSGSRAAQAVGSAWSCSRPTGGVRRPRSIRL